MRKWGRQKPVGSKKKSYSNRSTNMPVYTQREIKSGPVFLNLVALITLM